jgi:hypothetical protein
MRSAMYGVVKVCTSHERVYPASISNFHFDYETIADFTDLNCLRFSELFLEFHKIDTQAYCTCQDYGESNL